MNHTDAERLIFEYADAAGQRRYADPLEVRWRLQKSLGGDADEVVAKFYSEDLSESFFAAEKLKKAICFAFGLGQPFDQATGEGVRWEVWSRCLEDFLDFLDQKKTSVERGPTLPTSTQDLTLVDCPTPNTSALS